MTRPVSGVSVSVGVGVAFVWGVSGGVSASEGAGMSEGAVADGVLRKPSD